MGQWSALLYKEGKTIATEVERVEGIWENECHLANWYGLGFLSLGPNSDSKT